MTYQYPAKIFFISLLSTYLLTACGFKLRGYEKINNQTVIEQTLIKDGQLLSTNQKITQPLFISFNKGNYNRIEEDVKKELISQFSAQGIATQTVKSNLDSNLNSRTAINISKVKVHIFQLVGVLTEVNVVVSANVRYQIINQKNDDIGSKKQHMTTIEQPITLQRSYQYNQASVNTNKQQEQEIKKWLSELLAQRIADHYIALTLYNDQSD